MKSFLLLLLIATTTLFAYLYLSKNDTKNSITLGASLPLSGINKKLGEKVVQGANTYFSYINDKGGINNKQIKFIFYDDKYEPRNTLKNTNALIEEDEIFALFGFVGTPTTKKILPIVLDKNIPFIAPYTGASFLRDPRFKNIINFRSSYKQEIEKIIEYLHSQRGIDKFAIFYQNDDYGEEGYIAIIEALQKRGLILAGEGTYKRNTLSIRHALHEIKSYKPEAIIMVGAYKPSARFIKKAREKYFKDTIFAPISFVNSDALMEELDGNAENILFSQTVPSYDDNSLRAAKEYIELLSFYYPNHKPSYASFESFLAAKLVAKALQDIEGSLNSKKFLKNLRSLSPEILGEIPIDYKDTQLLNKTYLSIYIDGKFEPIEIVK